MLKPFSRRIAGAAWSRVAASLAILLAAGARASAAPSVPPPTRAPEAPSSPAPASLLAPLVVAPTLGLAPGFDVPEAVTVVGRTAIARGQPQVNLSESLQGVPGLVAQNRQDYAEDLQLSIRGFGAIAPFGVQGVRLVLDGLPATMPDGQGQTQIFDLPAIQRIEVVRGPFALGYGNSPGGVIRAFTRDGPPSSTFGARSWLGSYGSTQSSLDFGGSAGSRANYALTLARFHTDGYRANSAATRKQLYAKTRYQAGATTLTFLANLFHQQAQDPGGLTAAELAQDPRQAAPATLLYRARKDVHNSEGGVLADTALSAGDSLHFTAYAGTRSVLQFLPFAGGSGLSSGGVVNLADYFGGVHGRFAREGDLGAMHYAVTTGADYDRQNEYRKGFVNDYGTAGALRRNEFDVVDDFDQFVQGRLDATPRWAFNAGLRHNLVRFDSQDFFVDAGNPDDSGGARYSHTDPMAGSVYRVNGGLLLYASYGRGFQTPTFYQLAYRPDGRPGLNFALQPAVSDDYEAGVKALLAGAVRLDASVFHIHTSDEIVVAASVNGRTSYTNAGTTARDGVEIAATGSFAHHLHGAAAVTYIDARYTSGPDSGQLIPGVPQRSAYASLTWEPPVAGFYTTAEVQYRDRVYANDANSAAAAPYAVANWWFGFRQKLAGFRVEEFARVDNLFDRSYVGAVVVDDGNGRYFEPAPGRGYTLGVRLSAVF